MRRLHHLLAATVALALFVAPVAAACGEEAMFCGVAVTDGCDEMPGADMAVDSRCHTDESAVMKCCEFDTMAVVAASLDGGSRDTLGTPGRVTAAPVPESPRLGKAVSSNSAPRSSCARYVLFSSYLV